MHGRCCMLNPSEDMVKEEFIFLPSVQIHRSHGAAKNQSSPTRIT